MTDHLPGPDALAAGLTSLTASGPLDDGGCLPCQERQSGSSTLELSTSPEDSSPSSPSRVAWRGVLGVEGEMTGDGRMIATNALRVDDLPIPLRHVSSDVGGHDGAVTVGTIESVEREPGDDGRVLLVGEGFLDLDSPAGPEAARGILSGAQPGVSLDLDSVSFEVHVAQELVTAAQASESGDQVEIPRTEDGHYIVSKVSASDEVMLTTDGRIRAATLVAIPAFATAKIAVVDPDAARSALTASGTGPDSGMDPEPLEDGSATEVFNWVDDAGGLPGYIDRIRKHLEKKGMTTSHAIATAVNVVKKMCSTGDVNFPGKQEVNAGSQAEACAAVAQWEEMKAKHSTEAESFANDAAGASTVAENVETIPADYPDETECAFPDCDAPAALLVPLLDDPAEEVDPDEEPEPGDPVPYCTEHGPAILEEIGDEPCALGDLDEGWALDEDVLTQLFSPEEIAEFAEHYEILHAPPGSDIGGQFISPGAAASASGEDTSEEDQKEIDDLSKLSAKALAEVLANLQSAASGMTDPEALAGLNKLISHVKMAQANVAATASKAKKGGGGKGSAKAKAKGSGSGKGKSGGGAAGKSSRGKSSGAAAANKAKRGAERKAKAAEQDKARAVKKVESEKKKADRKAASDKAKGERIVAAAVKKVAAEHAKNIRETKAELSSYYKKFNTKISPEERGHVQESIDKLTETLKKLESQDAPSLTASAAPDAPPRVWFQSPGLSEPTPLTITQEGRVFGHLAAWNTCHTSHTAQGQCVLAPRTQTNYAYFHTGAVLTAEGVEERVGHITMDTRHAGGSLGPAATMSHYEDTGTVIADVACGEDAHGIWFSGALRPWATEKQVRMLRSSPLSGDWRRAGNGLELVAALAVNVPGFPVPRPQGLVASGHVQSLIASGMIAPSAITDTVTASAASSDPIAADDTPAEGLDSRPTVPASSALGTAPAVVATPTVADHLTPEDLAHLKRLAERERESLRSEADALAREMLRDEADALAADVLAI